MPGTRARKFGTVCARATLWALVGALASASGVTAAARQSSSPRVAEFREQGDDAEFSRFRARLLAAAESGDVDTLAALTRADISFFYEPAKLQTVLEFYEVAPGHPWIALRDALRIGTDRTENTAVAPATHALGLGPDDAVVIAGGVRLRASRGEDARVLRTLAKMELVTLDQVERYDAELVERSEHPTGATAWARVTTADGQSGYVYARLLRSVENSRFVFRRLDGEWKLASVAAGPG